ncbi:phage/plasmid primase, P4 family [Solilutibacter oculi]|nr:phage/plasmid primase, P4 family [Lysobacter oculi]
MAADDSLRSSIQPSRNHSGHTPHHGEPSGATPATPAAQAIAFAKAIDPDASQFEFRTFAETGRNGPAGKHRKGVTELAAFLIWCDEQGRAAFMVINEGGQDDASINRVRAHFVDIDRKDFESDEACERAIRFALEGRHHDTDPMPPDWPAPSIVVSSGGGGAHAYWLVKNCEPALFTKIQRELARKFNGDASCSNLSRVMRVPGSIHRKGWPTPVELVACNPARRYTLEQLRHGLSLNIVADQSERQPAVCDADPSDDPVLRVIGPYIKADGRTGPHSRVDVICPNHSNHSLPDGLSSTVYMPHGYNGRARGFRCLHGGCVEVTLKDFLTFVGYSDEENCPNFNSDDGLACRFVNWLDGRAMYSRGMWYVWQNSHWLEDSTEIRRLLKTFAKELSLEIGRRYGAAAGGGDSAAKTRLKTSYKLLDVRKQEDVLKAAAVMLTISEGELDAVHWSLSTPNGEVDLRTGTLSTAAPMTRSTNCTSVPYSSDADCPRWRQFLREIFVTDEVISYAQRFFGYALTGETREETMLAGYGCGANGKSVFAEAIRSVLGTYVVTADPSVITAGTRQSGAASPDTARLVGKRLALLNESRLGDKLDDGMIKKLVSIEKMAARRLYGNPFEFTPTAKLFLRTNNKPQVHDGSDGMWRRLQLLPFERHFPRASRDPQLLEKLLEECEGILSWMVQGAVDWYRTGLRPPAIVKEATKAYRAESDTLGEWLSDRVEHGGFTPTAALLHDYVRYTGVKQPVSVQAFARALAAHGFSPHRTQHSRGFKVTLKTITATDFV